jgi:hypothetical protein
MRGRGLNVTLEVTLTPTVTFARTQSGVELPLVVLVRGQLPSSLREKFLYQHVSIYLHAGMFVCLFICSSPILLFSKGK